jgi:hypothetical protein
MRFSRLKWLSILVSLCSFAVFAQIVDPFSAVPTEQRDGLSKRLDGYVEAYKHRDWEKLYGFVSEVGKGGVDERTFVAAMSSNHGEDFAQYPDLQEFSPLRTWKNADGYDVYGCGRAVREGDSFAGLTELHAVFEHENWFFTGWAFRDSSENACKQLSDPDWKPDRFLKWNTPMEEVAHLH